MAEDIGLLLRGLGAAFSNQVPEFRQQMATERENQYIQSQREQQAQMQRAEMMQARQRAMYQDAESALKLLAAGDLDSVVQLGRERIELLNNFPDADTSDTVRITQLAQLARAGDRGAYQSLQRELLGAVQRGMSMGYITPPEQEEYTLSPGEVRMRGSQVVASAPSAPTAAYRQLTAEEVSQRGLEPGNYQMNTGTNQVTRIGGGGTSINVPPPTPPSGYMNQFDAQGNFVGVVPTPGGPVETARQQAQQTQQRYSDVVLEDIGRYKDIVSRESAFDPVTGFTGTQVAKVQGTMAFDAAVLAKSIEAGIAFDRLQAMREASPTGGALGAVTEGELDLLKSSLGSISQSQSQGQLLYNLNRLEEIYSGIMQKFAAYPSSQLVQPSLNSDPLGIL